MPKTNTVRLAEMVVDGMRLGRHVEHDVKSVAYEIKADLSKPLKSVSHERHIPILNQGNLGSCTGNAGTGLLGTDPFFSKLSKPLQQSLNEAFAVQLYGDATRADDFEGEYPPDDTGSSGLAIGRVLRRRGDIKSYRHAFGLLHSLQALQKVPVIIGISWYASFDDPGANGLIKLDPHSPIRGGHELEVTALDVTDGDPNDPQGRIRIANSWDTGWGDDGYCEMDVQDFDQVLRHDGDVMSFSLAT